MIRRRVIRRPLIRRFGGLLAVLVLLLCAGCGVTTDDAPRPLDEALGNQGPAFPEGGVGAPLYFVRDDRLVPVTRRTADNERSRLSALLAGVSEQEAAAGLRNAVPATVRLRGVSRTGPTLTVDLSGDLGEATAEEQTLALAQIVFTATEAGPSAVRLLIDGVPVQVPRADGTLDSSELDREQFRDQAPAGPVPVLPSPAR